MSKFVFGGFHLLLIVGYIHCEIPLIARNSLLFSGINNGLPLLHHQVLSDKGIPLHKEHVGPVGIQNNPMLLPYSRELYNCIQNCLKDPHEDKVMSDPSQTVISPEDYYKWLNTHPQLSPGSMQFLKYYPPAAVNKRIHIRSFPQYSEDLSSGVKTDPRFPSHSSNSRLQLPVQWLLRCCQYPNDHQNDLDRRFFPKKQIYYNKFHQPWTPRWGKKLFWSSKRPLPKYWPLLPHSTLNPSRIHTPDYSKNNLYFKIAGLGNQWGRRFRPIFGNNRWPILIWI